MIKNSKNVQNYLFGADALRQVPELLNERSAKSKNTPRLYFVDHYFQNKADILKNLSITSHDLVFYVPTKDEPTTDQVDEYADRAKVFLKGVLPSAVVGMGGGITLDCAKAVANLLTNPGKAADYQGWDLVKNPAPFKLGIPTLSGTGAEASRTCVMMNFEKNLKLGMNSEFTIYDQLVLDPNLTETVDRDQYFYTGMDSYIHCVESLAGQYRNAIGDAFSRESLKLCEEVFLSEDMMKTPEREKLMVASYLGGCAIANSFVGIVHPLSAALSVVLHTHHCVANCIVMNAMEPFYPEAYKKYRKMVEKQKVKIPTGICKDFTEDQFKKLYESTIIHEKPLINALGPSFRDVLTFDKVKSIFKSM